MPFRYLFLLLLSFLPVLLQAQKNANKPTLYAAVNGLRVRSAPELDAETVHHMAEGEAAQWLGGVSGHTIELTLRGIKYQEPWLEIKTWEGKTGWVYGGAVRFFKPQGTITPLYAAEVLANVDNLSVRSEPNLKAKVVGRIPEGDAVKFLGRATEKLDKITLRGISYLEPWVLVELEDGTKGWAYAGGLRIHEPVKSEEDPQWWLELEKRAVLGRINSFEKLTPESLPFTIDQRKTDFLKPADNSLFRDLGRCRCYSQLFRRNEYCSFCPASIYAVFKPRTYQWGVLVLTQTADCCQDIFFMLFDRNQQFIDCVVLVSVGSEGDWSTERTVEMESPTYFYTNVMEKVLGNPARGTMLTGNFYMHEIEIETTGMIKDSIIYSED